jgi:tetratricopeptide (TPR) repeat protein
MEEQGNFTNAISEYRAILAQDSSIRDAYMNLGYVYSRLGRFSDAMNAYRDCLALGSDYLLYFNMGSICYKLGSYKNAVINLERARKMNSGFALSTLVIGLSYSRMNNIRAAEVNFRKVLEMWPSNRVALTALSIMYFHQERHEESLALLERLISMDGDNARLREFRSRILFRSGKFDESVEEIKQLTRISRGYRLYNEFISIVPVEVLADRYGTLDDKIDLLGRKAEHDSGSLISLSLCHLFKGETDLAMEYLYRAKKINLN